LAAGAPTRPRRAVYIALALLFGVTLTFTYMRGPMLGCLVGLAFFGIARLGHRLGGRGILAAFFGILTVYAIFVTFVGPDLADCLAPEGVGMRRFASFVAPHREEGMSDRFRVWEQIWPIVADHPLGLGLGSSGGVAARYEDALRFGAIHSDNVHLAMLLELG